MEYTYDAWGYIRNTTGSLKDTLGKANALRYRGYVYDPETALYYLQSRYYNPGTGRFINADALVATGQGLLGNNMFAYCLNNPANGCDPCGTCFHRLDFWNDCEKCGGKTIKEKWRETSTDIVDAYNNTIEVVRDCYETTSQFIKKQISIVGEKVGNIVNTVRGFDGKKVFRKTVVATLIGAAGGATEGWVAGYIGVPITEGFSLAACAAVGAIIGGVGGLVVGFLDAISDEIWEE